MAGYGALLTSRFNLSRRIRGPLAPRARVQLRTGQSRVLEREQVVAGGHARAAVADETIGGHFANRSLQPLPQIFGRSKHTALVEVPLKEMIRGAGDVARLFVDRLGFAAI